MRAASRVCSCRRVSNRLVNVVKESQPGSGVFDVIIFARRDIESVSILPSIKVIDDYAFYSCKRLKNATFELNSSLESIKKHAFDKILGSQRLILPPSLKEAELYSFVYIKNVKWIEFLGKSVTIKRNCFDSCQNLEGITFPNADEVIFDDSAMKYAPKSAKILVKRGSRLSGKGLHDCQNEISYIESHTVTASKTEEKAPIESEEDACIKGNHDDSSTEAATEKVSKKHGVTSDELVNEENKNLKKFVSYLQRHLSKYEDVISYNDFVEKLNKGDIDIDIDNKTGDEKEEEVSNEHAFVGPDDEEDAFAFTEQVVVFLLQQNSSEHHERDLHIAICPPPMHLRDIWLQHAGAS